jgi:hypothetical protein
VKTAGRVLLLLTVLTALVAGGSVAGQSSRSGPPAPPAAVTGATINPKAAKVEIHVDPYGEDTNAGTPGSPLKTIRAAVRRALANQDNGQSVRIRIAGGVYREPLNLDARTPFKGNALLVIEPADKQPVTLTGADLFRTGWLVGPDSVYRSEESCGVEPLGAQDIAMGRAVVYVNDDPYWLVADPSKLTPYRAYIEPVTRRLHLRVPEGMTPRRMAEARVEIVRRNFLLRIARPNVAVRGVRCIRSSLLGGTVAGKNILLEDCEFVQNAAAGLLLEDSEAVTVRGARISRNAGAGLYVRRTRNIAFENIEAAENDDGNAEAARAGILLTDVRGARLDRVRSLHNRAHGLRMEGETGAIALSDCRIVNNLRSGIFGEIAGPLTLSRTEILHNTRGLEVIGGSVALNACTLAFNTDAQVRLLPGLGPLTWNAATFQANNGAALLLTDPQDDTAAKAFLAAFHGESNRYGRLPIAEKRPEDLFPASLETWSQQTGGRDKNPTVSEAVEVHALLLARDGDAVTVRTSEGTTVPVKVGFYDRNRYLWGEAAKAPFTLPLSSLPPGAHTLTAWAVDKNGRLLHSAPLTVTVP